MKIMTIIGVCIALFAFAAACLPPFNDKSAICILTGCMCLMNLPRR